MDWYVVLSYLVSSPYGYLRKFPMKCNTEKYNVFLRQIYAIKEKLFFIFHKVLLPFAKWQKLRKSSTIVKTIIWTTIVRTFSVYLMIIIVMMMIFKNEPSSLGYYYTVITVTAFNSSFSATRASKACCQGLMTWAVMLDKIIKI